ncbi:MAG TPA: TIGR00159 family protein [Lachnospiraceae bacterium]|nr:TIGR00159 family protein [Lachnospiraceae bacterium]
MEYIKPFLETFRLSDITLPTVGITDVLDILIVAYIAYKIIFWIKETRAWILFKGILVIFVFAFIALVLGLNTILWILSKTISVGIIAVIVVFQPELRKALEQLGKGKHFTSIFKFDIGNEVNDFSEKTVEEILRASGKMSKEKTGALMLIEREVPLGDFERTGIPIDALVTSQLIINIFEHNTPLHDGAVIIKNNRIAAATCFLPLTDSNDVSMELGTRHRAGIGASEVSDAYVIIVSEETGAISLARGGVLYRNISIDTLRSMLSQSNKTIKKKKIVLWKGRHANE